MKLNTPHRMRTGLLAAMLLGAFTTANPAGSNVASSATPTSREGRWKEDLDCFARELPAQHKDFFKLIPRKQFEERVRDLERRVPQLSDTEVVFCLQRFVASLGVGHTRVDWPPGALAFHNYPVAMFWYSDGLGVLAASPEYREAIGARVVRIGSMSPEEAEAAVAPYISHENDAWLKNQSPGFLTVVELLQHLKIAKPDGRLSLSLVQPDGKPLTLEIAPASSGRPANMVLAWEAFHLPTPICHKHPDAPYWYECMPEAQALYIHYRACRNALNHPFEDFVKELFAFADSSSTRRIIIDLRNNGGGDSEVIKPLVRGLKARPALSGRGQIYVLIARSTFSSGLLAAIELRNEVRAILVGEPTGGKPNCYGNTPSLCLPNSQLRVWYCNKYFRMIKNSDPPSLDPDIAVPLSLKDFLRGRDPALETALNQSVPRVAESP